MLLIGVANAASGIKSAAQASQMVLLVVITIRHHWSRSLVLVTLHSLTPYLVALHSVHVYAQVHTSIEDLIICSVGYIDFDFRSYPICA